MTIHISQICQFLDRMEMSYRSEEDFILIGVESLNEKLILGISLLDQGQYLEISAPELFSRITGNLLYAIFQYWH